MASSLPDLTKDIIAGDFIQGGEPENFVRHFLNCLFKVG
jgi:hypothetical protein